MYYRHKLKCQGCGLHFVALSDNEDWPAAEREPEGAPFCPECGRGGFDSKFHSIERVDGFIFQEVPGTTVWGGIGSQAIGASPTAAEVLHRT